MEQVVLQISGMGCGGCAQRIQMALSRLGGVRNSSADHRSGEVRVVYDPSRTSSETVRACIVQSSYEVSR